MISPRDFFNVLFGRGPSQMECCAHCGAMSEAASLRCPSCNKLRRPVVVPFLCAPALVTGLFALSLMMTKVIPTYADLASGCGVHLPAFILWGINLCHFFRPISDLIPWLFWCSPLFGLFLFPRNGRGTRFLVLFTLSFLFLISVYAFGSLAIFTQRNPSFLCHVTPKSHQP